MLCPSIFEQKPSLSGSFQLLLRVLRVVSSLIYLDSNVTVFLLLFWSRARLPVASMAAEHDVQVVKAIAQLSQSLWGAGGCPQWLPLLSKYISLRLECPCSNMLQLSVGEDNSHPRVVFFSTTQIIKHSSCMALRSSYTSSRFLLSLYFNPMSWNLRLRNKAMGLI